MRTIQSSVAAKVEGDAPTGEAPLQQPRKRRVSLAVPLHNQFTMTETKKEGIESLEEFFSQLNFVNFLNKAYSFKDK